MGGCCVSSAADVPLTTDNICKELDGTDCMKRSGLGVWLNVPVHQRDKIERQHSTQANQTRAIIDHWLSVDPTPSWRRVVHSFEWSREHKAAERVKPYVEPLTGEYCMCDCMHYHCRDGTTSQVGQVSV